MIGRQDLTVGPSLTFQDQEGGAWRPPRYRPGMAPEPFANCVARLNRAIEHRDSFANEWADFLAPQPYRVYCEVAPDGHGRVGIVREAPVPVLALVAEPRLGTR